MAKYLRRTFASLCGILIYSINIGAAENLSSTEIFKALSPVVFKVETSETENIEKESYGTGFVVDKSGLILTNFHVVADAVSSIGRKKIFVVMNGKRVASPVIAIDAVHDLALIKVSQKFEQSIELQARDLENGEAVFSLGFPMELNASVVQGNFNGLRKAGPYEAAQLSSPINPGMSGGPTVDASGKLVGVNVSILMGAQNISFLVPAKIVKAFLQNGLKNARALSHGFVMAEVDRQLHEVQQAIYGDWKANEETMEFDGWKLRKPMEALRCWTSDKEDDRGPLKTKFQRCSHEMQSMIWTRFYSGYYDREVISRSGSEKTLFGFYETLQEELGKDYSPFFAVLKESPRWKPYLSNFHCKTTATQNTKGIPFSMAFCTRAHGYFTNLYDTSIRVVTRIPEKRALSVEYTFSGFDPELVTQIVQAEMNSIDK